MRVFASALVCCLIYLAGAPAVVGQTFLGGIRGAVKDTGGGVIPGVEVTITNEATNVKRSTVTNERGEYVFASVPPGTYTVSAALAGFKTFERPGIIVSAAGTVVIDATLEPAAVQETITVTGESPIIETASASVSAIVDKAQLDILPSPGRNVFIYAVTTPNVIHTGDPVFVRKQDQTNSSLLSLAGGPLRGNNYTMDGVSIVDMRNRAVVIPNNDAVEEMKVQVNTYDAEMGRTGGGVFNIVHRSGGNNWAGSGLWQNRPNWGRGRLFFDREEFRGPDFEPTPAPYNLASGGFGGPIVRDKTFFWVSTEAYKNTDTRNAVVNLPTRAQVNGDFRGTGTTIYDPLTYDPVTGTRQPFPNNTIPANRMDPVGKALAEMLLQVGEGPLSATAKLDDYAWEPTVKVNHNFNEKWQASGLYMYYGSEEHANRFFADLAGEVLPFDTGAAILFRNVNSVAINVTNIPSESSVLTFRYGYNRFQDSVGVPSFDISTLPFSQRFIQAFQAVGADRFPYVQTEGYGEDINTGPFSTHGSWASTDIQWKSQEVSGVYSKFVGGHTIKGGLQYRRIGVDTFLPGYVAGFDFTADFTRGPSPFNPDPNSGDGLASLLLGFPTDNSNFVRADRADVFTNYYGGFVQDDWRIGSDLVFNFGVRIEHEDGLHEVDNRFTVGFDRDAPFPVQVPGLDLRGGLMYAGVSGYPDTQSDPRNIKVGPRAGFAYSINPSTVLRGGYGIFWAPHQYPDPGETTFGTRGYTAISQYVDSFDGINPACTTPGGPGCLADPYPNGVDEPTGNALGLLTGAGTIIHFNDQFAPSPYVQQWSVDIQRELGAGLAFKIGYLGSKANDLWLNGTVEGASNSGVNINQLDPDFLALGPALNEPVANPFFGNPAFGPFGDQETIPLGQLLRPYPQFRDLWAHHIGAGKSRYDALRVEFEKRFRGSWGARLNYTYSRYLANIMESNTRVQDEEFQAFRTDNLDEDPLPRARIDSPHWLNINGFYKFPSPDGGAAKVIAGGWSASVTGIVRSGFPLTIKQSSNNLGSAFGFDHQRPNVIGDPSVSGSTADRVGAYINPAAFENAPAFTFGNVPFTLSDYRTPPLLNWDVAFEKTTDLGADADLVLRFEFVNLFADIFDQFNWNGPSSIFGTGTFGQIRGVGGFPRIFQFIAKIVW